MLSRIRKQLNRDNKEVSSDSSQLNSGAARSQQQNEQSGFICPICMINLSSAEGLQAHFEEKHSSPDPPDSTSSESFTNDVKFSSDQEQGDHHVEMVDGEKTGLNEQNGAREDPPTAVESHTEDRKPSISNTSVNNIDSHPDHAALQHEINDLKASLTEEKWYTEELKKEVEHSKSEKDKLDEECSVLKQQMSIAIQTNEELAKQKESLEQKASRMSQSIAELKSINDECVAQKEASEERSKNQSVELEKAAAWVRDLESQLLQRPGADDVMVLKKELVSVQTLMDQLTLESEEKGKEVEKERQELQRLLDEAQSQAKLVQEEFDAYKRENARLKSENEETTAQKFESAKRFEEEKEKLNQLFNEKQNTVQEEVKNLESALEKEQSYSKSLEIETNRLQEDKASMEKDINRLSNEFNDMVQLCDKEKEKSQEVTKQCEDISFAKTQLETEVQVLKEDLEKVRNEHETALNEKEKSYDALCVENENVKKQLSDLNDLKTELNKKNEILLQEANAVRSTLKQSETDSNTVQQQLSIELAQLKIKQEKLEEDKQQLLEQKSSLEQNTESLRKIHEEERNSLQTQLLESDRQLISFKMKVTQLEDEVSQKSSDLKEIGSKIQLLETNNGEFQNKNHTLNTELALKMQEIDSLKEKVEKSSLKLEEEILRREKASEEAVKLREERSHLMAQMEAGEGEAVARAQIAEENEMLRKQKEESEEKWRKEMSEQEKKISELTSKLKETSLLLTTNQEQLQASEQTIGQLRDQITTEHEKLVQSEAEIKTKIELLTSAETSASTQRADMENHINTVKRSLEEKTKDWEKANNDLISTRSTIDDLKSQMSELRQEQHVEVANLRNKLEMVEKEREDVAGENEKVKQEIERIKEANLKENEKKKLEWKELEAKHEERIASLQSELSDSKNEIVKNCDEKKREESLRTRVEVELNQYKRQMQESEETLKAVQSKLDETLAALESANVKFNSLHEEKNTLTKKYEEFQVQTTQDTNSLKENHENEKQQLQNEIDGLQEDIKSKDNVFKEEQNTRIALQENLSIAESTVSKKTSELEELNQTLEKLRADNLVVKQKLTSDVSNHAESVSNLKNELEKVLAELDSRNEEISSRKIQIEELNSTVKSLKNELEERTTVLTETEVDLENTKTELKEAESKVCLLEENSTSLDNDKSSLQLQIGQQQNTIQELQEKIDSFEKSNKELSDELSMSTSEIENLQTQSETDKKEWFEKETQFTAEIKNLDDLNQHLNVELEEEKMKREEIEKKRTEDLNNLQLEVDEKEMNWRKERESFQEKVDSLEAAQSLLVNHKVELKNTIESLQSSIESEKKLSLEAEEESKKSVKAKDDIIAAMKSQLEAKNRELETAEADRVVGESRLQLEIGTLSENLNSTRAEWVACTQKIEAMGRDNDDLKGQIVVLNATIQSNNDERRALLERCLNAEQQTEQLNGKVAETKRKLDDAHSAMHELGRENQALQVKHKTTISRQWTDDRSAVNCKACGRTFSMTVRRHHCRHCGEIFCNDCSSRSATVASSKSPVRVCERCYDELLTAG